MLLFFRHDEDVALLRPALESAVPLFDESFASSSPSYLFETLHVVAWLQRGKTEKPAAEETRTASDAEHWSSLSS
jgi:hypothetical protein